MLAGEELTHLGNDEPKALLISVIEINARDKTVREIKIENSVSIISKKFGFKKHSEIFLGEAMACLIVAAEESLDKNYCFEVNGIPKKFYGSGIVVRVPKNYNMKRLLKCNITIDGVREMVTFS